MVETWVTEIEGKQPMLQKSSRSVDTTDPLTKEMKRLTSKGKKSDADMLAIDRLEFELGLYMNKSGPFVPDVNIIGCIRDGARIARRGREVQAGIDVVESEVPLIYDGPRTVQELYDARFADRRMVKNKGKGGAVMRVRPRFNEWKLAFSLEIETEILSPSQVHEALVVAGSRVGLSDFRPRFGRFRVTKWEKA